MCRRSRPNSCCCLEESCTRCPPGRCAIVVPLAVTQSMGGTRPVPAGFDLDDLTVPGKSFRLPRRDRFSLIFQQIDRGLKLWERRGPETLRRQALRRAEKWLIDHTRYSDGLGAIYPSMMYLIMALECPGLSSRPSRPHQRHRAVRQPADRKPKLSFTFSLVFRRFGTRPTRCSHWARWATLRRADARRSGLAHEERDPAQG